VSISKGVSSNYNCWSCCPYSHNSSRLDPDTAIASIGGTTQFNLLSTKEDCYGQLQPEYTVNASEAVWSSSNTTVATCDATGMATGIGVGQAGIIGTHEVEYWTYSGGVCYPLYFPGIANALCVMLVLTFKKYNIKLMVLGQIYLRVE